MIGSSVQPRKRQLCAAEFMELCAVYRMYINWCGYSTAHYTQIPYPTLGVGLFMTHTTPKYPILPCVLVC